MNNTFSFERLFALIRKQWIENSRFYMLGTLALLGLMTIALVFFWVSMDGYAWDERTAYVIYLAGLFIVGSIYGSISFSVLGSKEKGQYWLSIPASHLEKLITTILYNTMFFFVVYTACFFLVKFGAQLYIENTARTVEGASFTPIDWNGSFGTELGYFMLLYFTLQTLYILGSVYFKQYAFIKTTIIVSVLCCILIFVFAKTAETMFSGYNFNLKGLELRSYQDDNGVYRSYSLGEDLSRVLGYILKYSWVPLFWVVTWFRLTEKEI
jgi:hypothetical protein